MLSCIEQLLFCNADTLHFLHNHFNKAVEFLRSAFYESTIEFELNMLQLQGNAECTGTALFNLKLKQDWVVQVEWNQIAV